MPVVKTYLSDLKQREGRYVNIDSSLISEYICCMPNGEPIKPDYVTRTFKQAVRALGFSDDYRFHDLRHTLASYLMKKNIGIHLVRDWMGHAHISTTLHYTHLDSEQKTMTADVLNNFLDISSL